MREPLLQTLIKDCRLPRNARVLVGLSGGADSVALLRLLLEVCGDYPLEVRAAHLDHGLRLESAADARWVGEFCARWQVPLAAERVDVAALARHSGTGLEEAGRQVRRDFLQHEALRQGCDAIALGHQRGDQAETVLHRLLRGTSLPGLAAMRFRSGPYIRPLLGWSRPALEAYLAELGQPYLQDASNSDPAFTRNRLRHEVLPLLRQFNPRIEEHLAALAQRSAEEEDFWRAQEQAALDALRLPATGELRLARKPLAALAPALGRRVLRRALGEVRGQLAGLDSGHLEELLALVAGGPPQAELHLPRCWAATRYDALVLRPAPPQSPEPSRMLVDGPGEYPLPDGRCLRFAVLPAARGESAKVVEFALGQLKFPFQIRGFSPGDRIRLPGLEGRKKLKELFAEARVAQELRRSWPLLWGEELLWVVGLRRCAGYRPETGAGEVLRVELSDPDSSTIRL